MEPVPPPCTLIALPKLMFVLPPPFVVIPVLTAPLVAPIVKVPVPSALETVPPLV